MAKFNQIEKQVVLSQDSIVKAQLVLYCFTHNITLSTSELNCLTFLALSGGYDLSDFCEAIVDKDIFSSYQTVRNCVVKLERLGLISKSGKSKKRQIYISPDISIISKGNIFVNYKLYHVSTQS